MPEYLIPLAWIIVGIGLLAVGGELLVRGAARLAAIAGISPLVIGLTVVALGTSAPEMAVTLQASVRGQTDLAVGNVVGSNICNVLLILGLSALAAPLVVSVRLVWWDVPLMVLASLLVLVFGRDGTIGRWDGGCLFLGLLCYVAWAVIQGRRESRKVQQEFEQQFGTKAKSWKSVGIQAVLIVVGLVLLTVGSNWLVGGAVTIARLLGVGELVIGLTILAVGTSLPELAASVVASIRGERDIAAGNIVGSNLFNILGVLGLSALIAPHGIAVSPVALQFDIPVMIAVAVACLPLFAVGHRINRLGGGILFAYYWAYTGYLVLDAWSERLTRSFGQVMLWFVIPLTAIGLTVSVVRSLRKRQEEASHRMEDEGAQWDR